MTAIDNKTKAQREISDKALASSLKQEPTVSVSGGGIRFVGLSRAGNGVPEPSQRVLVHVASNIVDRYEGQTDTWTTWASQPNKEYIARALSKPDVLVATGEYLVNRSLAAAIEGMIPTPTFRPNECLFTKPQVFTAVSKMTTDPHVAQVLAEMLIPFFIKIGMVSDTGRFAQQIQYPFGKVDTDDIAREVAMVQAFGALDSVRMSEVALTTKQSRSVFAAAVAEAFRPVGLELLNIDSLNSVVADIVIGVRAVLTPPGSAGSAAVEVPSSWAKNPLVGDFAQCLPFINAALRLSSSTPQRLSNEGRDLEPQLRLITQVLRDSARYHWLSSAEAIRHYTHVKIRDVRDNALTSIVYRSLKAVPIAQTVIAVEDVTLSGARAMDITPTKDRVAEVIQAAYGSAQFSTEHGADAIRSVLEALASSGYRDMSGVMLIDAGVDGLALSDIAALISYKLWVQVEKDVVSTDENGRLQWWYGVQTNERNLKIASGDHYVTEVLTSDPVEALLASPEFTAKDVLPARRQLIGPNAFNARVLDFAEDESLIRMNKRFGFSVNIAGVAVNGALKAVEFASMRTQTRVSLVRPYYNAEVIGTLASCYSMAYLAATKASTDEVVDHWSHGVVQPSELIAALKERCAFKLLKLAQQLSPNFRSEVQRMIIARALAASETGGDDAIVLRSQLVQQPFSAYCDLLALEFFLFVQGIDTGSWHDLISDEAMARTCILAGSDRSMESYLV